MALVSRLAASIKPSFLCKVGNIESLIGVESGSYKVRILSPRLSPSLLTAGQDSSWRLPWGIVTVTLLAELLTGSLSGMQ